MLDARYCAMMARYNEWMNTRLYALCAGISDAERRRDRGAFFGSIHRTLDHLLHADLAWLSRMTGDPATLPGLEVELFARFDELRLERESIDRRLLDWCAGLTEEWLRAPLEYTSQTDGVTRVLPHWVLVTHLFNHQTHHRGQLTTLLTQIGQDIGATDLHKLPGLEEPT